MNHISSILIDWYDVNKRDLPWRQTADPYLIWLSEIILQQTRVDQGLPYYLRFVERFPTVAQLADADEDTVLKLWQGLGYYSRARNLHAAARTVVTVHGGVFPQQYADVLALKGVGEYTAAAIVSFAYGEPYAVVDGNVYRVLSRLFGIDTPIDSGSGKKEFARLAQELLDVKHPGLHNQAMMEFGALQCVPVSPDCEACPAVGMCIARAKGKVSVYPVKQGKVKVRDRFFNYFDIRRGNDRFLVKRTEKDIWQNLYELPMVETATVASLDQLEREEGFVALFREAKVQHIACKGSCKHILSHQRIHATFYLVELDGELPVPVLRVDADRIGEYAIPQLIHNYLDANRIHT